MPKKFENNDSAPSCKVSTQPSPAQGASNMKPAHLLYDLAHPVMSRNAQVLHVAKETRDVGGKDPVPFPPRHTAGLHFPVSLAVEWQHMTGFWPMKWEQTDVHKCSSLAYF